ncbi:MAG: cyanophycin synthetase [Syntrophomonadaceae bacterium]
MEVISVRKFSGRNIYSHRPVVRMTVDLGGLAEVPTNRLDGFNQRLLKHFPGLKTHHCSLGYQGGFVERLQEGTLISHVTEHLALELQSILGYDVYFGKTRVMEEPHLYCILYEYMNESSARTIGYAAAEIVMTLVNRQPLAAEEIIGELQEMGRDSQLGPSTRAIFDEARRRHIPVRRIGPNSLLQLGYGRAARFIEASLPGTTSSIAVDLARNKQLAKELLRENNIPVPAGGVVYSEDAALALAEQIGYPVVVKPGDSNQGKGVSANIYNETQLRKAFQLAWDYSDGVIVEKYIRGCDYRVLVVGDQVSAVAERRPPYIIGDGVSTIAELVEQENLRPERGEGHERPLSKIVMDTVARELLARTEMEPEDIPKRGELVYLRQNGNLSTGGSARECTRDIHPRNKELAIRVARVIGLDVAGIDIVTDNIAKLLTPANGAVIEVNSAPGLRMHLSPSEGTACNVAADILDHIYADGHESIPVISITGTNGKTTVTRLVSHVLTLAGKKVGMTCSSGTYIGAECISKGDNTGPASAQSVLYNAEVEAAVLETARGGMIKSGLGYDLADVGLITNISDDHLGVDDVNTLQDLAFVKSLVVEAVKPDGWAILNADDQMTEIISPRVRCNLGLFGRERHSADMEKHIEGGGLAAVVEDETVCLYRGRIRTELIGIKEIPITFGGKAVCNIENALAAAAALYSLGNSPQIIRLGLMSFRADPQSNAGRLNLFDLGQFQVLLDYGHNLKGYQCVSQLVQDLGAGRLVGVIGMPGDRLDRSIYEVGQLCGGTFAKLYIKEDEDLRGRKSGEVADILRRGAVNGGADRRAIEIILSETVALKVALDNAQPGDLIVIFYEKFEPSYRFINDYMKRLDRRPTAMPGEDGQAPYVDPVVTGETTGREMALRVVQ